MQVHNTFNVLLGLSVVSGLSCKSDSKSSFAPPPEILTSTGITSVPKPTVSSAPTDPATGTPVTLAAKKAPEGITIFKAGDHCVKANKLYGNCKEIPREGFDGRLKIEAVTPTTNRILSTGIVQVANFQYDYFCNSRQDETYLQHDKVKYSIHYGAGEVNFNWSFGKPDFIELKRKSRSFTSVDEACEIVITKASIEMSAEGENLLRLLYPDLDASSKKEIIRWLSEESIRLKETSSGRYAKLIVELQG